MCVCVCVCVCADMRVHICMCVCIFLELLTYCIDRDCQSPLSICVSQLYRLNVWINKYQYEQILIH